MVGILCVFSMTSISIVMTNDELSFIKSKEWSRDMKNALLHLAVICNFCKVLIRSEVNFPRWGGACRFIDCLLLKVVWGN